MLKLTEKQIKELKEHMNEGKKIRIYLEENIRVCKKKCIESY